MDYKKKIELAEKIADQLQGEKTKAEIEAELQEQGLYDRDITSIMVSARNILGEKYQSKIRTCLLEETDIHNSPEFGALDKELIDSLIDKERRKLENEEKKKITKLMKEGKNEDDIFAQVDTRFLSEDKAASQIVKLQEVKQQNSGSGRMLSIGGGIGILILTVVILLTTGRLFFILPIIGLGLIAKGFITERMEYED